MTDIPPLEPPKATILWFYLKAQDRSLRQRLRVCAICDQRL